MKLDCVLKLLTDQRNNQLIRNSLFLFFFYSPVFSQTLPIKASRTISFIAEEGTDMNVDISPDGKTILIDLLGDIYSLPSKGGNANKITRGIALSLYPIWSPDGKKILYFSDGSGSMHLNVRDLTGKFHAVLDKSSLEETMPSRTFWTPDGNFVAVDGSMYHIHGGKKSLTNIHNILSFSRDGQMAYYIDSGAVYEYSLIGHLKKALTDKLGNCDLSSIAMSPEAKWLAFVADSNKQKCLILRNIRANEERVIVSALQQNNANNDSYHQGHFAFSTDSKYLYIGYRGKIHRIETATAEDKIIPFSANVTVELGELDYNRFRVNHNSLKIRYSRYANSSPDRKQVAFTALNKLYLMTVPNGKPHLLAQQPINQAQPVYSTDGKWITYVSWCDTAGGQIWKVPSHGGQPEQITKLPADYQCPAWSPDGKFICALRDKPILSTGNAFPKNGELILIPLNGDSTKILDQKVPYWNHLSFSPDGKCVIYKPSEYVQNLSGNQSPTLVSRNIETNELKILATDNFGDKPSLSPDGKYIAYIIAEDIYLTRASDTNGTKIKFHSGVDFQWEESGKTLNWNYGNKFYRINPDKVIAVAESQLQKNKEKGSPKKASVSVNVNPDQEISLNVTCPRLFAKRVLVLKNARIITMHGHTVIERGTVVIRNGRFLSIGKSPDIKIPKGAKIIDLAGATIMPGLIDLHLHMRLPWVLGPQQSWMYLANLAYGVTTARDPSSSFDSFGYGELLQTGQMIGPRLFTVGHAVRQGDEFTSPIDNLKHALAITQKRATMGGTCIKQYSLPTRLQRQWLLMASSQSRLNMTNEGDFNWLGQLAMIKDGSTGIEHSPEFGDAYKDVITLMTKSGTFFTPTLQVRYGEQLYRQQSNYLYWHNADSKMKRFLPASELERILQAQPVDTNGTGLLYPSLIYAAVRKAGGKVTLGSHGEDQGIGAHNELWALQMGGLSNMQALQAATIIGAEALGIQRDLGSIEVGKIADLIILNKNPLDDIHNSREIRYVMKDGVLYDGERLDEIWPVFKKCPEWKMKTNITN